jgi:hypothetical protein
MSWVTGQTKFEATISGLADPNNPGDVLKLRIEVSDPDGPAEGAPLAGTVTLSP